MRRKSGGSHQEMTCCKGFFVDQIAPTCVTGFQFRIKSAIATTVCKTEVVSRRPPIATMVLLTRLVFRKHLRRADIKLD